MGTADSSVITSSGSCSTPGQAQESLSAYNEAGQGEMDGDVWGAPGEAGSQSVLAPRSRQGGLQSEMISVSAKSPKVQGQEVICSPEGWKRGSSLASRLLALQPGGSGHTTPVSLGSLASQFPLRLRSSGQADTWR